MVRPLMNPDSGLPAGGGSASNSDKDRAGGKLPAGSSAHDRVKNGAQVANTAARNGTNTARANAGKKGNPRTPKPGK